MRSIRQSKKFEKDIKRAAKQRKDMNKLARVVSLLSSDEPLPVALKDHPLKGNLKGFRDCHIEPDWVLIYKKIDDETLELHELFLDQIGTHSEILKL